MTRKREYVDYKAYKEHQIEKTNDPVKRKRRAARREKDLIKFAKWFEPLKRTCLKNGGKALSLGSWMGTEVEALKHLGFDAVGIDLVPYPPLVLKGDFHKLRFKDSSFQLVYSNAVDHVYDLDRFVAEVSRVLTDQSVLLFGLLVGPNVWGTYLSLALDEPDDIVKPFEAEGFKVLELSSMTGGGLNMSLLMERNRNG